MLKGIVFMLLLILCIPRFLYSATCDPQGGINTIGLEYIAETCPPQNANDSTVYHYIVNAVNCIGGRVNLYAPYGDFQGTPAFLMNFGISQNYKVFRNSKGNHFIFVHRYYNGLIEGIEMGNYLSGRVYYDVITPPWVAPQYTGGNTTARIEISLQEEASSMCIVDLEAYAVSYSGGHGHHDALRPHGWITSQIIFNSGEKGPKIAEYISSEVAGIEEIEIRVQGTGEETVKRIEVKMPILGSMPESFYWRLTGLGTEHSDTHYGTAETLENTMAIALDFYEQFSATLGINDMSLEWGGLFDINGNWIPPHRSHRRGMSVDIDRCARSSIPDNPNERGHCPEGWISVPRDRLRVLCRKHKATLLQEPTLHCEF